MKNTSFRQHGEPSDSWRSLETITAAAFATRLMISRSIIGPMQTSLRNRSTISRRFAGNVIQLQRRSSGDVVTEPPSLSSPMLREPVPAIAEPPQGYERLRFRIIGASPLVMHNGQLASPLNPIAREMKRVSGKRAKTDSDYEQLAKLEFLGSLYLSAGEPCIPGEVFESCLTQAAKKARRGAQAKAGIICDENFRLEYEGPRSAEGLWTDEAFRFVVGVRVGQARVMRCRPVFRKWSATVVVDFLPDQLNGRDIIELAQVAGRIVGLCDWRPKFGRFSVEI